MDESILYFRHRRNPVFKGNEFLETTQLPVRRELTDTTHKTKLQNLKQVRSIRNTGEKGKNISGPFCIGSLNISMIFNIMKRGHTSKNQQKYSITNLFQLYCFFLYPSNNIRIF